MDGDIPPATSTGLNNTVQQYLQMAQNGNVAGLQQNAIPSLASNFGGVQSAVQDNQPNFAGAQIRISNLYLLDYSNPSAGSNRAEFFCGIYNSPDRLAFVFPGLQAGQYAVAVANVSGGKTPLTVTLVLQNVNGQWKLAGYNVNPLSVGGHDANWYLSKAREYAGQGKTHDAWFYYLLADTMMRPLPAMSTPQADKLYDEFQKIAPQDLPSNAPVNLVGTNGKTYKITDMFATPVGDTVDLVVKYPSPDISSTAQTFQDNVAVINALVKKYPELREAFGGIVARAVAPSGQDYGTLLTMNNIK
jgi:hypothetical protein